MAKKEVAEVEAKAAVEKVKEADKNVDQIKAEKAAKKAERQAKRLTWKGPLKVIGKGINWCENNPVPAAVCVVTGTGLGWGGKVLYDHFVGKKTNDETEAEETPLLESETAPFDTEA